MPRELTDRVPTLEEELADADAPASGDAATANAAVGTGTAAGAKDDAGAVDAGDAGGQGEGDDDAGAAVADAATTAELGAAGAADEGSDAAAVATAQIPKARFDEVNERRKNAEEEARQLREMLGNLTVAQARGAGTGDAVATAAAETPRDFDKELETLVERYEAGEVDEAVFKREERKLIREQARADVLQEISPVIKDVQAERDRLRTERVQDELNKESAKAIEKYPFLDSTAESANKEAIAAVLAERDTLIRAGIPVGKALRLAVSEIAPQFGAAVATQVATDGAKTADEVAAQRRARAQNAAAKVEGTQPPPVAGAGNGPRTVGKQTLGASVKDHEKWEKIPEAERAKALGA